MKLPNAEFAEIPRAKLVDYSLNPFHEVGKHKARVFRNRLGLTELDADFLKEKIQQAALNEPVEVSGETDYGLLYRLDFELTFEGRTAMIRTGWIIRFDENWPRLTTCFVR